MTVGRTSQPSASRIIEACSAIVLAIGTQYVHFPPTAVEVNRSKGDFERLCLNHGFPRVLGVVDGTHVGIVAPSVDEGLFVNRKNYHSINGQVVASADQQFFDIVAKYPGSSHDSFVWHNSSVSTRLSTGQLGDGWFLG